MKEGFQLDIPHMCSETVPLSYDGRDEVSSKKDLPRLAKSLVWLWKMLTQEITAKS